MLHHWLCIGGDLLWRQNYDVTNTIEFKKLFVENRSQTIYSNPYLIVFNEISNLCFVLKGGNLFDYLQQRQAKDDKDKDKLLEEDVSVNLLIVRSLCDNVDGGVCV